MYLKLKNLNIIGVGTHPSEGLRRGVVVNLEKTVNSVEKAVKSAELMAGVEVKSVYAGICGDHIRSLNSRGVVAVSKNDNEIMNEDINRAVDAAPVFCSSTIFSQFKRYNMKSYRSAR